MFINHMLALAKQHVYESCNKRTYPSLLFIYFLFNKVSYVHQLVGKKLLKSNNKVANQECKNNMEKVSVILPL